MARVVGITTNPGERRRHWEGEYPNLRNWMILARYDSKSVAQLAERHFAGRTGAVVANGEAVGNENDEWVVYRFDH